MEKYIDTKITKRIPKDQLKVKTDRQTRPKNGKYVHEVKINQAIYNQISIYAKKRDSRFKTIQELNVKAIIAMAQVA